MVQAEIAGGCTGTGEVVRVGGVVAVSEGQDTAAVSGLDATFDVFFRSEYAAVVRLGFALTGRRDIAEEVAQDGFLACHQRWEAVSRYDDPAGWVRRVVTNRCISVARRRMTELRLIARMGRERVPAPALARESAEVWGHVRRLPRRQAQVLALAFLEDRSVGDIAALLDIGEESVRTHLRRGRAALARMLTEE